MNNRVEMEFGVVEHGTNQLSSGYQTRDEQTQAQYSRGYSSAQATYSGRVLRAQTDSSETINLQHRNGIMPERELMTDNLRTARNFFGETEEVNSVNLAQPAAGLGTVINPT